jgi:acyl-CoA synthetase (AMP-forming)/AMP-acid ligase II
VAPETTWWQLLLDRDPGSPAVVTTGATWSTADLLAHAAGAAGWLTGVPVRAAVATVAPAGPGVLALALAAAVAGKPLAPLNSRSTGPEIGALLEALGETVLVADPAAVPTPEEWAAALPGITVVTLPEPVRGDPAQLVPPAPGSPALILHTSGTTGLPKQALGSEATLARRAHLLGRMQGMGPGGLVTNTSPFHHIAGAGLLLAALGTGAAVAPTPRYDLDAWRRLTGLGVTHTMAVPTMLHDLLRAGALADTSLQLLSYGASPMDPALLRQVLDVLPDVRIMQLYGQTEGSPITWLTDDDHRRALAEDDHAALLTVGSAAPGVELWLHEPDETGCGEVVATGDHFFGAAPGVPLHTGDLGRLDDRGRLVLVGRVSERIVRGGENVEPLEVERVLNTHPAVQESAVLGVPDPRLGQRIRACLVLTPSAETGTDWDGLTVELRAHARERLSGYKVPDEWVRLDSLPRNASGKVMRRLLT